MLCEALATDTGQDKKDVHAYFSTCFLSEPITLVNAAGEIVAEQVVVRSTTGLSAEEFREYVDRCAVCAADHIVGGYGARGRGRSALAPWKVHVCDRCHMEIHAHILAIDGRPGQWCFRRAT